MHAVSLLAVAFQEQVPFTPAAGDASDGRMWLWIALIVGALALLAAFALARTVIAADTGTADMQVISNAIREGAEAFLKRQYRTIGVIAILLAVLVFIGYHMSDRMAPYAIKDGGELPYGSHLFRAGGIYRHVLLHTSEHPNRFCGQKQPQSGPAYGTPRRRRHRLGGRRALAPRYRNSVSFLRWTGEPQGRALPARWVRIWSLLVALFAQLGGAFTPRQPTLALTWWVGRGRNPRRRSAKTQPLSPIL